MLNILNHYPGNINILPAPPSRKVKNKILFLMWIVT